ncbi:MAG: MFS transporter [Candidatus Heimdallarchaeota archaeon]
MTSDNSLEQMGNSPNPSTASIDTTTIVDITKASVDKDSPKIPEEEEEPLIDTKGNKRILFWLLSVFTSTGQFFFGNFFSAFAAEANVSGALMGFITSIRNLLSSVFQPFIGFLSDKLGRKFIMFIGIFLNFAITVPLIFFESTWLIVTVAIVQALSLSIFLPTWNALLGDVTKPEIRATFIGKIAAIGRLISVSFSLAIALIFYLAAVYEGEYIGTWQILIPWRVQYSTAFAIAAINSLIASVLILSLKETRSEDLTRKRPQMRVAFQDKNFMKFVIFYALFSLSLSFLWPINPILQVTYLHMEFYQIAILSSVFILVMSLVQVISGRLGDKLGRKPLFVFGAFILVFYPVSMLPAIITGNWLWLIAANTWAGFGVGSFFVSLNALTLDLAPDSLMGAYSGIRELFFGVASFGGSLAAGFIIDALNLSYGLYYTLFWMLIGISVLRFIASLGFLFVAESLPKHVREERQNGKLNRSKLKFE